MSQKAFVSVVIPSYNRAHAVIAAIESILTQTYDRREIIVVDDGSTDGTADAINRFLRGRSVKGDDVRQMYQHNQGPSAARNRGIAEARGNWIAFLDSDDAWLPEKLERQVRAVERFNQCGACFTDAKLLMNRGLCKTAFQAAARSYHEDVGIEAGAVASLAKAFGGAWIQTLIARTDLVRQIGGFDVDLHFAEDYDFLFRLFRLTQQCYVNIPLAVIDRTSMLDPDPCRHWEKLEFRLQAQQLMFEKWLRIEPPLPDDIAKSIRRNLRAVHSSWANCCLEGGKFKEARTHVSRAVQYEFTGTLALKWMLATLLPNVARKIVPKSKAYSELT
jgi:hypothetical protein